MPDFPIADAEPQDFHDHDGVALVTGGTGGLGSAVCRLLAARGSDVAFTYNQNTEAAEALALELEGAGRVAISASIDLTDEDAVFELVETLSDVGGVHTFVHAAGPRVPQVHLSSVDAATFSQHLDAEALAFFTVARACLRDLRTSDGAIIAITSAATDRYAVRDGLSAGPKAAIESLVRGFAAEEGRYGIRANAVGPGMLSEGMAEALIAEGHYSDEALDIARRNIALRRFGTAADVAEAVCFLASERANYISGQILNIDGGYSL